MSQKLCSVVVFVTSLVLFVILQLPTKIYSAKILSVSFFASKSHKMTYEPLLYKLADKGHQVTILSHIQSSRKNKNVRDILLLDLENLVKRSKMPTLYEMKEQNIDVNPFKMLEFIGDACAQSYDLPIIQEILKEKFDLVFTEAVFNECVAGLIHKLNTTLALISTAAAPPWVTSLYGNPSPPSFVAGPMTSFTDKMTFYERILNFLGAVMLALVIDWSYKPAMEDLYRGKLNDSTIPTSDEIFRNASLLLSCSHFSLGQARPFLPDIVEVGGMHLEPPKQLPENLATFADSSGPDGFIYISFGSGLKGSEMPERYRELFVRVFSKLKQKVLWKWETETMKDLPKNVKLSKWVPQQDVLGHPNCKLFITHGGLGGTTEAVYHGVPMVGIPLFGDQPLNMRKAEASGYALTIEYDKLTEENLSAAIQRVISEKTFRERVQHLSKIYKDQFGTPLDRAVFWTEYILRHNGAPHLRSPARDLNSFQYYSLDVIFTLLAAVFLVLYIAFASVRFICRKLCGGRNSVKAGPSKKKIN